MTSNVQQPLSEKRVATNRVLVALVLLISVLPFWSLPIAHIASDQENATGMFFYELPYYVANGRAAFSRGNGVLYPNPYDPADDAPVIYAHWVPWLLGAATAKFDLEPGKVMLAFTATASLLMAFATFRLIEHRSSASHSVFPWYLAAMWGGGLLVLGGLIFGPADETWTKRLLAFDPGRGFWFLNWGRNSLIPTEATYHVLVATCWLAEVRKRLFTSNVALLLLATTHPWSGLELLFTICLWRSVKWFFGRNRSNTLQLAYAGSVLVLLLGYYKVWLPTFEHHAQLQRDWELDWSITNTTAFLAYAVVFVPAAVRVRRAMNQKALSETEQFLLCTLVVAIGLAFHDRFMKPVQPLHFARGYIWFPLFLIGLPVLQTWLAQLIATGTRGRVVTVLLTLAFFADNAVFAIAQSYAQFQREDGFHITAGDRELLTALHRIATEGNSVPVVLTESDDLNYLLPAYSSVRPWVGHHFNTPEHKERLAQKNECFSESVVDEAALPEDIQFVAVRETTDASELLQPAWQAVELQTSVWRLFRKTETH